MGIESHIIDLLRLKRQAVIPEIGQFKLVHQQANTQPVKGVITPPKDVLVFSNREKGANQELINHISNVTGQSNEVVEKDLSNFVKRIQDGIKAGRKVRFGHIGYFHQDKAYQMLFVADDKAIQLLGDQFGLEPVKLPPTAAPAKKVVAATASGGQKSTQEKQEESTEKKRRLPAIIWMLLGLFLLIFFAIFILSRKYELGALMKGDLVLVNHKEETIKVDKVYDLSVPEKEDTLDIVPTEEVVSEVKSEMPENDTFEVDPYAEFTKFYLIVGSFDSERKARLHMRRVRREGYIPDLVMGEGRYRVSIGLYSDREKALKKLYELRAQDKTIWIWSTN